MANDEPEPEDESKTAEAAAEFVDAYKDFKRLLKSKRADTNLDLWGTYERCYANPERNRAADRLQAALASLLKAKSNVG